MSSNALCPTDLAQILAGKACSNYVTAVERTKVPNITNNGCARKLTGKNSLSRWIGFAQHSRLVTVLAESEFEASDSRKQPANHQARRSWTSHCGDRIYYFAQE